MLCSCLQAVRRDTAFFVGYPHGPHPVVRAPFFAGGVFAPSVTVDTKSRKNLGPKMKKVNMPVVHYQVRSVMGCQFRSWTIACCRCHLIRVFRLSNRGSQRRR